jgi:hypothetical protein
MAWDMLDHGNAACRLQPRNAGRTQPHDLIRVSAEGAITNHLMRTRQAQIQNRRADNIQASRAAHRPQQIRIGALSHLWLGFEARSGGEGLPLRRLQARHAPAFLVNQDRRRRAQHIADIIRERAQLLGVLDVPREKNRAKRWKSAPKRSFLHS